MSTGEKIEDFIASILSCITYNIVVPTVNNVVLLFANNVVLPQEQCCATTGTMLCYHRDNVVLPQEQCCAANGDRSVFFTVANFGRLYIFFKLYFPQRLGDFPNS